MANKKPTPRRGRPPKPRDAAGKIIQEVDDPLPEEDNTSLEWAEAVAWAVKNCHVARMSPQKAGSKMRFAMWQFGRENSKELMGNMMYKSIQIREKYGANRIDEEAAMEEEKAIKEIDKLIAAAIAESQQ